MTTNPKSNMPSASSQRFICSNHNLLCPRFKLRCTSERCHIIAYYTRRAPPFQVCEGCPWASAQQQVGAFFTDHHARRIGVGVDDPGHDGSVGHADSRVAARSAPPPAAARANPPLRSDGWRQRSLPNLRQLRYSRRSLRAIHFVREFCAIVTALYLHRLCASQAAMTTPAQIDNFHQRSCTSATAHRCFQ